MFETTRVRHMALVPAVLLSAAIVAGTASVAMAAGGTVTGKITLKGTPPAAAAPTKVTANPEQCGTEQPAESLVGAGGAVKWAVVRVTGAKGEFAASAAAPTLDQHTCKFTPHVVVVPAGKPLKVLNNDGILHNVHTFSTKNAPVNSAQPGFRKVMDTTFAQPEIFRVGCDVHPWMSAYVVVADSPFVAVTDENGAFSIDGVPPGSYTVTVWHESFGEQTQQVTVAEGQKANVALSLSAKAS